MLRGSLNRRTTGVTTGTAAYELIAPQMNGKGCRLFEMCVTLAAATASTYSLGRPAAKGITPTSPVQLLSDETPFSDFMTATALAWGTGPTVPVQFYRQVTFPATISSYIRWTFEKGLFIPANTTLVLWNSATNGVVDVCVTVEEE